MIPSGAGDLAATVERILALAQAQRDAEAVALGRDLLDGIGDSAALPPELGTSRALNQLGMFFFAREYPTEAVLAYTPALAVLERCAADDRLSISTLRNNLGQAEGRLGHFEAARAHLEASLALKQAVPDAPLVVAITQDNLGSVLAALGETERAEQLTQQALETFERIHGEAHADVATALGNLGRLYADNGDATRARACYLRSLDIHLRVDGVESPGTLITATNLVKLCLDRHDDRVADELADLLLAIGGDQPDATHHAPAVALLTLAGHAFEAFSLGLAERLAMRARTLLDATEGPRGPRTLDAMTLLANVFNAKGNTAAAERLQMQVLDVPGRDPAARARTLIDFGKSLRARGRGSFGAAVAMFEHALQVLRDHPDPALRASALGNLGQLRVANDEPDAADALFGEALATIEGDASRYDLPWLLHNRAMLHYHLGRHEEALEGCRRARDLWARRLGERHPFVATVDADLALVHWARGDSEAAARAFASTHTLRAPELSRLLAVGSERERLASARERLGDLYKVVSFHLATNSAADLAATMLLQHKGVVLDAVVQSQARLRRRLDPGSRVLLDQLADVQRRIADAITSETLLGGSVAPMAVASLQTESDRLQSELGQRSAFGQAALEPPSLAAVGVALPAGGILLEYLRYPVFDPVRTGAPIPWLDARYAAMVLRTGGAPQWVDLGDAKVIDAAVQQLRERLADEDAGDVEIPARALAARIVAPLAPMLAGARLLLVAPDAALNLVPFGMLVEPVVDEDCGVGLLVGGRELLRQATDEQPSSPPHAFVDPDFDASPGGPGFEPLPGTRAEARALQALWPDLRVLGGADATVEALRAVVRPSLLHIATHGHFVAPETGAMQWDTDTMLVDGEFYIVQRAGPSARADAMLHGGLALAGANRSRPGRPVGIVSAAELAQLDLRGTALVVLSACDTGLGSATQGDEFSGLRRAFAIAGAESQVTSLWWVDDEAGAALMAAYSRRLRDGAGRAEALRQAQREVRGQPGWAHPAYWAAFVAWGDAGPLPVELRAAGAST